MEMHSSHHSSHQQQRAASDTEHKTCFIVTDEADGKRYKVFLRPSDFPKLKVSKIRKTVCQAAQLESTTSFDLLLNGVYLADHITGAHIGLAESTVLTLRRKRSSGENPSSPSPAGGAVGTVVQKTSTTHHQHSSPQPQPFHQASPLRELTAQDMTQLAVQHSARMSSNNNHQSYSQSQPQEHTPQRRHSYTGGGAAGGLSPHVDEFLQQSVADLVKRHQQGQDEGRSTDSEPHPTSSSAFVNSTSSYSTHYHANNHGHHHTDNNVDRHQSRSRSRTSPSGVVLTEAQIKLQEQLLKEATEQQLLVVDPKEYQQPRDDHRKSETTAIHQGRHTTTSASLQLEDIVGSEERHDHYDDGNQYGAVGRGEVVSPPKNMPARQGRNSAGHTTHQHHQFGSPELLHTQTSDLDREQHHNAFTEALRSELPPPSPPSAPPPAVGRGGHGGDRVYSSLESIMEAASPPPTATVAASTQQYFNQHNQQPPSSPSLVRSKHLSETNLQPRTPTNVHPPQQQHPPAASPLASIHHLLDEAKNSHEGSDRLGRMSRHDLMMKWKKEVEEMAQIWEEDRNAWEAEKQKLLQQMTTSENVGSGADHPHLGDGPLLDEEEWADLQDLMAEAHAMSTQREMLVKEVSDLRTRLTSANKETQQQKEKSDASTRALMDLKGVIAARIGHGTTEASVERTLNACISALVSQQQLHRLEGERNALQYQLEAEVQRRRDLHGTLEELKGNIRVIARVRPPITHSAPDAAGAPLPHFDNAKVVVDEQKNAVAVVNPATGTKHFEFYRVLGDGASQHDVFAEVAPLVQTALDGFNVGILAYGQTGSGKTHTILGSASKPHRNQSHQNNNNPTDIVSEGAKGLLPRAIEELFLELNKLPEDTTSFHIKCSMVELYNDQMKDLLSMHALQTANQNGPALTVAQQQAQQSRVPKCDVRHIGGVTRTLGVSEHPVRTANDALSLLYCGGEGRQVHATKQNTVSSRSHAVFTVHVAIKEKLTKVERTSKLVFVDLAGSERVSKSQSTGERLKEAQHINKSLSALGDVVHMLSRQQADGMGSTGGDEGATLVGQQLAGGNGGNYVPYRNSKLTLLLQDCIGGTAKTVLVACLAPNNVPHECNTNETLSTLQFASRVRRVRNGLMRNAPAVSSSYGNSQPQHTVNEDALFGQQQDPHNSEEQQHQTRGRSHHARPSAVIHGSNNTGATPNRGTPNNKIMSLHRSPVAGGLNNATNSNAGHHNGNHGVRRSNSASAVLNRVSSTSVPTPNRRMKF